MPIRLTTRWFLAGTLLLLGQALLTAPAEELLTGALSAVNAMRSDRPARETAAEAAAQRFLRGGHLYVAGSLPAFDREWTQRAGGLMAVSALKDDTTPGAEDVLVYGCRQGAEADDAIRLRAIRSNDVLVIAFGGGTSTDDLTANTDVFLPSHLPAAVPMSEQLGASMAMAHLWAFTGDLVAACTRAGKMPAMWQSMMVEGATERNARYRALRFHDDLAVPPVPAGILGDQYLAFIAKGIEGLQAGRSRICAAGTALRQTVQTDRTVFFMNLGHFDPSRMLPADCPVPLVRMPGSKTGKELRAAARPGDALLIVWYTEMPEPSLQAARETGVTSICMVAANPMQPLDTGLADIFIDPQWTFGDTAVDVPGYDIRVLPPSGVMNSIVFYAILAEAEPQHRL